MPERDSVFHRYTAFLARRAGGIVVRWTAVGGALGLVLGSVTLTHWAKWPVSHREAYLVAMLGLVCGAFLGRAIGSGRAQWVLFQAQLAQHQLEFERRLLAVGAAMATGQPVPQPHPQPVAQPQPQHAVETPPAPVQQRAPEPVAEAEPVYLSAPPLAFSAPDLPPPTLPEPTFEPEHQPEPAAFEPVPASEPAPALPVTASAFALKPLPEAQPADVVPFVPRPEPISEPRPLPSAAAFAPVGVPPLSGDLPAAPAPASPAAPAAESPEGGYGWQQPGVIDQ